ncbi:hypothetical protein [Bacillus sinesaloumensis]|uniref:hypothetical protein n=1 Tax=Litchfieldia sinesaloumensis TaxID=1926280 RepID=UPI00190EEA67|nr:hypothetical protein [Bacillus sinesaloumensis]
MSIIIRRKILTAIISSLVVVLIFMVPGESNLNGFANLFYLNVMIVITYGVIASITSDWMSKKMFTTTKSQEITSFLFHCLFGSVFLVLSLVSAISFFIVDRLLTRVKLKWWNVILAVILVILVFFILILIGD